MFGHESYRRNGLVMLTLVPFAPIVTVPIPPGGTVALAL
jgi:hypothetical protein